MADNEQRNRILLPTFTHLWKVDGVIYTLGDLVLPMPLNIRSTAAALITFVPLLVVIIKLGLTNSFFLWFLAAGISAAIGWASDKPAFGGRTLLQLVMDQIYFIRSTKVAHDLVDGEDDETVIFDGEVFVANGDDMDQRF